MMNQQAMDSLYSATYMEDYLDCVENLPDDIQRNMSRMRDLDIQYSKYMKELETAMEDLMEQIDVEQADEREDEEDLEQLEKTRRRRKYSKARSSVQEILMKAQDIGDEKLQIAQNVQDNIENKARQLELDKKNLEYGRENENQETPKEERERPGIKRARRAKHEVFVPSIMGPSTLEVTSYVDSIQDEPKPSTSRGGHHYNSHANEKTVHHSTAASSATHDTQDRKTSTASQPDQVPTTTARERHSTKGSRNNETESSTPSRASERTVSASASVASPAKQVQKANVVEKKGKKRKSTKQSKSKDASPPDDADTIDPDEPTYCLCDQISYGEMIGCDNDLCPIEWFHFSCVSLTHKPKGKWYCPRCRGDKPNVMKNRTVLIKELAKYNREREEKA
ncbi:inhibitor of growth protein 2 isoform X2 [Folsomia candida]|uniref:inhibitor of growth protein 2 isoform X2 n=1 Tax=Folsomia candida TaxID=158441 RepID=UPI000B8FD2A7|nr:inhibitor of growth protein 2 isoform X2 [Folsomia candida]